MVLRLRQVHKIEPLFMRPEDILSVSVNSEILRRELTEGRIPEDHPITKLDDLYFTTVHSEKTNYEGIINTVITFDLFVKDLHSGIVVAIGKDITPEDVDANYLPPLLKVEYQ